MQLNPTVLGAHYASKTDPLLIVPSHHSHHQHNNNQQRQQMVDYNHFPPATAPRFDSPYSLHEDVATFLNCIRLALQNPYTPIDQHLLRDCIGFTKYFPLVDGITDQIWGGAIASSQNVMSQRNSSSFSSQTPISESQQKMLLWMQELQHRLEAATKRNLDIAASAFGPCEEARRDRGVSGTSDVEAVRSDLEWWLKQHEELEQRLKVQKEFLKKINADMDYTATGGNTIVGSNTLPSSSAFRRASDLQDLQIAKALAASSLDNNQNNKSEEERINGRNLWTNLQKTMTLVDDVATLSRSISQQQQELQNQQQQQSYLPYNNNNNSSVPSTAHTSATNSRSVSQNHQQNNNKKRSASVKDVAETLNYELLALQATRYRAESVAETREKLVQCVLSLGSVDYGNQKFVRSATNKLTNSQPFY